MRYRISFETRTVTLVVVAAIAQLSCSGAQSQPTAPSVPQLLITGAKTLGELTPTVQLSLMQSGSTGANNLTSQATWQSSNGAIATVSAGLVQAVAPGSTTITASYGGQTASTPLTVAIDDNCVSYSPPISLVPDTADTPESWSAGAAFNGGTVLLAVGDTITDANNLVALFQRYSQSCTIGKGNSRPNRLQYILNYQRTPTGQQTVIAPQDCIAYNPAALTIANEGTSGWAVMSAGTQVAVLDTSLEAAVMLNVAQGFSNECFIGRQNTRLNHYEYVTEYWQ